MADSPSVSDTVLDVREEIPARRHELILGTYGDLAAGTGFVLEIGAGLAAALRRRLAGLHVGDVFEPIDPAGLADRLRSAGSTEALVESNGDRFSFRARKGAG